MSQPQTVPAPANASSQAENAFNAAAYNLLRLDKNNFDLIKLVRVQSERAKTDKKKEQEAIKASKKQAVVDANTPNREKAVSSAA